MVNELAQKFIKFYFLCHNLLTNSFSFYNNQSFYFDFACSAFFYNLNKCRNVRMVGNLLGIYTTGQ